MSKEICVIGVGYVGLVTGAGFADLGNNVVCLNRSQLKCDNLKQGIIPIYEPGLEEIVRRNIDAGRLHFTTDYAEAMKDADLVFVAVGTPTGTEGEADLAYVQESVEGVADVMTRPVVIINKSTVPIGTGDWVAKIVSRRTDIAFSVVSNPEFLREGSSVYDFYNPDRVVLGSTNPEAAEAVADVYRPLNCPILITDLRTAEMIKYASNAFLATRISFINEMSAICEELGADVTVVARGMGMDKRIGLHFLNAGVGWGGSCFPKDVKALEYMASVHGCHPQLLRAVMDINRDQRRQVLLKLRAILGDLDEKVIGILGLSFKPNTDDMRDAPSIDIIHLLQLEGVEVRAYDPVAIDNARRLLSNVTFCENPYQVAEGADAIVLITEWNEFKQLDMDRIKAAMRGPVLIDGRNIYEPAQMRAKGFTYRGIGRGYNGSSNNQE
ncbi:MAG: UDP-glucose/GDP-mannose dehydrogenase family protein [Chloroflexi bacterium]|nr:UDP-glucose/GDP-mannose dehydrogenase family protein [Chloroflexota bacterium]MBU1748009.1 UDP-glucose/GDP-mannose dehydrogenase family protein [Chloroflexota bacterium]